MAHRSIPTAPLRLLAGAAALLLALAACAPAAAGADDSDTATTLRAPEVEILGGALCRPAELAGNPEVGLLCERPVTGPGGELALLRGLELRNTEIVYRQALLTRVEGGATLGSVATVRAEVNEVTLASGERCFLAGRGATLAFDGLRLNYSCDDPDVVLLGSFRAEGDAVVIERGVLERGAGVFELTSRATVGVARLSVEP